MAKKSDQAALNIHSIPVVCFSHQHVLGKSFFPYLWSLLISCWKNSTLFLLAVVLYVKSVYHIFFFKFINLWNSSTTSSRTWCIISDIECMYLQGSFQNTIQTSCHYFQSWVDHPNSIHFVVKLNWLKISCSSSLHFHIICNFNWSKIIGKIVLVDGLSLTAFTKKILHNGTWKT